MKHKIGIVDDHQLVVKGFRIMVETFPEFTVSVDASTGEDLQQLLQSPDNVPDILLLDVNMPGMGGIELAAWVSEHHPEVKLVALSMDYTDHAILGMIEAGCCSYLLKSSHPNELEIALREIAENGFYRGESKHINFRKLMNTSKHQINLTPKEKIFLPYACADLTYKEIADILGVTESTIENYRKSLFTKFKVQSRIGLAIAAIKRGMVDIDKLPNSDNEEKK